MDVLLYNLEQGTVEGTIIDQCRRSGSPLPPKIANKPALLPGLEMFLAAFYALSTCRYIGMGEGPIPWLAIDRYCTVNEIEGDLRDEVFYHVRKLDGVYLRHSAKRTQEKTQSAGQKGKLQAKPGPSRARGRK